MINKFLCISCNTEKTTKGHIFLLLRPLLLIFFILPIGGSLCSDCAHKYNVIGAILIIIAVPIFFLIFMR